MSENELNFSVLMSVYFKEKPEYFSQCLDSVLVNQSLKPNDVVIVVDGPLTDELNFVLESYIKSYPIISLIRLEHNVGLGEALRLGLNACKYPIVARMDTDDICEPTRFKKQIEFLTKNPNVKILGGAIAEFSSSIDNVISKKILPLHNQEIINFSKFRNPLNHMTVMFDKQSILDSGSYLPLFYLEDYFLWVRAIEKHFEIANLEDVLVYARVDNGMIERRSNKRYISSWLTLNKYMLNRNMISIKHFFRNMLSVTLFVYTPKCFKKILYKYVLRN